MLPPNDGTPTAAADGDAVAPVLPAADALPTATPPPKPEPDAPSEPA
jgi:hypothetical protein